MATEYGTLFSHASETAADGLVTGGHATQVAAEAHSQRVCQAQPGIESEPMTRDHSGSWHSATGLSAREIIDQRWA
ncbi:hypothetical protein [Frigoribacterium sp. UYMn621]|uniref:hypothetical protein n=1 Tax=Frigoribacterium sp. UYMn621 TaxID=3156343 RepID=UPI0033922FDF